MIEFGNRFRFGRREMVQGAASLPFVGGSGLAVKTAEKIALAELPHIKVFAALSKGVNLTSFDINQAVNQLFSNIETQSYSETMSSGLIDKGEEVCLSIGKFGLKILQSVCLSGSEVFERQTTISLIGSNNPIVNFFINEEEAESGDSSFEFTGHTWDLINNHNLSKVEADKYVAHMIENRMYNFASEEMNTASRLIWEALVHGEESNFAETFLSSYPRILQIKQLSSNLMSELRPSVQSNNATEQLANTDVEENLEISETNRDSESIESKHKKILSRRHFLQGRLYKVFSD